MQLQICSVERISEMGDFQIDNKGNLNLDILSKNKKVSLMTSQLNF